MAKHLATQRPKDTASIAKVLADFRAAKERTMLAEIADDAKTDELLQDFEVSG